MQYLISFLEGIVTFISPCMLPMLPLYIMYFSAGKGKKHTFINSCGFVVGFSIIFIALGALASTFGAFLSSHETLVNIISGGIVVLFGPNTFFVWGLLTRISDLALGTRYDPKAL